jgi:Stage II sporulation protein M
MTLARSASRVYLALLLGAGVVAAATSVMFAGAARHALGFSFTGVRPGAATAMSILLNNLALAGVPLGFAALLTWLPRRRQEASVSGPGRLTGRAHIVGGGRSAMDGIVVGLVLLNMLVVGAAIGAYGARMMRALLPHGPVEITGYTVALAAYLRARSSRADSRTILVAAVVSVTMLIAAALLETYSRM